MHSPMWVLGNCFFRPIDRYAENVRQCFTGESSIYPELLLLTGGSMPPTRTVRILCLNFFSFPFPRFVFTWQCQPQFALPL